MRPFRIALATALALVVCLAAGETGRRVLDGYRLSSVRLRKNPSSLDLTWSEPGTRSDEALLKTIPADADANIAWFAERPQPTQQPLLQPTPAWMDQRRAIGNAEANYVWNAAALNEPTVLAYLKDNQSKLDDVFTFRPPNGEPHPRYRFYPDVQTGFGVTNHFGWKSREITPAKPADVIRAAMLGDSTTNNYPSLVEHWLNLWAGQAHLACGSRSSTRHGLPQTHSTPRRFSMSRSVPSIPTTSSSTDSAMRSRPPTRSSRCRREYSKACRQPRSSQPARSRSRVETRQHDARSTRAVVGIGGFPSAPHRRRARR